MEQTDDKNYTGIMDNTNKSEKNDGGKITIHTMPKRYMASLPASSHAKSTGILILVVGFLFLVVALMLLYFYVLKKEPVVEVSPIVNQVNNATVDKNPVQDDKANNQDDKNDQKIDTPVVKPDDVKNSPKASSTSNKKLLRHIDTKNPQGGQYAKANDSDFDGLSDLEELLLGSSPNSEDTDGDGYHDQVEVLNLYDPASKGALIDSLNIEKYNNDEYDFSIFISSLWTVEAVSGNDSLIVSLGKDQYIQIMSQNIPKQESLDDWYMDTFDTDEILDEQRFKKGNWNGIINKSKLTVYLEHPNKKYIITLNYELGNDNTLYYKNIFDMMLQSISIIN